MKKIGATITLLASFLLAGGEYADASYGLYIGKNLTADGSVMLGGTGDEVSGHWIVIAPRKQHEPDATIQVGVTEAAVIPGELIEIPQVETTYKYIAHYYSNWEGFPPPLTNGGLNEYQVAARDIWSPSRPELIDMTKTPQHGLNYSDLSRIVLQRAKTAQEAVDVVGKLIDEYGYATYGGNSHLFADPNEGWVLVDYAGSQGLWVAEHLGPDEVRLNYPGYINAIDPEYIDFENLKLKENSEYKASDNFISFAVDQGWYDPDSGEAFEVNEIYGDSVGTHKVLGETKGEKVINPLTGEEVTNTTVADFEQHMRDMAPITLEKMMELVRTPLLSDDSNGYGEVTGLREGLEHKELACIWMAPTGSVTSPFIPFYIGTQEVPMEYAQHRYLYRGADATYLTTDYQIQEGTTFAARIFKQLMYFTLDRPEEFLPEVNTALKGFEQNMINEQEKVLDISSTLIENDKMSRAKEYLTDYTAMKADDALELGRGLLSGVWARTEAQYGLRRPKGDQIQKLDYNMINGLIHKGEEEED